MYTDRCFVWLEAGSQSAGNAADDRVDWRLDVCTNPYAEVREHTVSGARRPLCPPPPRTTHYAGETVVFRSNSNAVQLVINRQRRTSTDRVDGGPYFLIRYDGMYCVVALGNSAPSPSVSGLAEVNSGWRTGNIPADDGAKLFRRRRNVVNTLMKLN